MATYRIKRFSKKNDQKKLDKTDKAIAGSSYLGAAGFIGGREVADYHDNLGTKKSIAADLHQKGMHREAKEVEGVGRVRQDLIDAFKKSSKNVKNKDLKAMKGLPGLYEKNGKFVDKEAAKLHNEVVDHVLKSRKAKTVSKIGAGLMAASVGGAIIKGQYDKKKSDKNK